MFSRTHIPFSAILTLLLAGHCSAAPVENDFYTLTDVPFPKEAFVEVSALETLPDGKLAMGTRRGEIWVLENPSAATAAEFRVVKFADGLHEILGLAWNAKTKALYVTQRPEITIVRDANGDGRADQFDTFYDGWAQTGDYHEYNFASKFCKDGNLWTTLCLTGSFTSEGPWRGWCLRIDPAGKVIPTCSGVRSPGGMGFFQGDCFYTDNQGPWNGSSSIKHLKPGSFQGNPSGNKWYETAEAKATMGADVPTPTDKGRVVSDRVLLPQLVPAAIILPHSHLGQSSSGLVEEKSEGKFGPFAGQLLVGDQCYSNICRCSMEQVNGVWQGAAILLREGLKCGVIPLEQLPDGSVFAGGADRGWGSRGGAPFALHRVNWTKSVPFEMLAVKARPDGFRVTFTKPVRADSVKAGDTIKCRAWTYIFQSAYGSPEVDAAEPVVTSATLSDDGLTLDLKLDNLFKGHVHLLDLKGVLAREADLPLLHSKAYYTLNEIPKT